MASTIVAAHRQSIVAAASHPLSLGSRASEAKTNDEASYKVFFDIVPA